MNSAQTKSKLEGGEKREYGSAFLRLFMSLNAKYQVGFQIMG